MNFTLSLVIYNPLEAILLVLFLTTLTGNKFTSKNLFSCFCLGFVNLMVQYPSRYIKSGFVSFAYDIFVSLFIMSLLLSLYHIQIYHKMPLFIKCFLSCLFNNMTIYIGIAVVELFSSLNIWFNTSESLPDIFNMIVVDTIIKMVQFAILFIFRKGVRLYHEKFSKKVSSQEC